VANVLWSSTVPVMQNRVYASQDEALRCPVAPLELVWDPRSGLVYNARFDAELLEYGEQYNNEQALSAVFREHLQSVLRIVTTHLRGKRGVVEVGCGKGTFLRLLRENGIDATGCDPAYEGDEPYIQKRRFARDADLQADLVILRHVLEHIPDPYRFIREIAAANGDRGLIYIEVPDLNWIVDRRAFYDFFYEHCNYFTAASLGAAFRSIVASGTFFGSQYLWVVADLAHVELEPSAECTRPNLSRVQNALTYLASSIHPFRRRFVWGAGGKGTTLAYLLRRTPSPIDYLIDINPRKQGCFSPVAGTPIVSPQTAESLLGPGNVVLIMNPNYSDEIKTVLPSGVSSLTVTGDGTRSELSPL